MSSYYVHIQSSTMVVPQEKYLLLTTPTSSPKQAGIDIDVCLEPLMEDMQKEALGNGVNVWDGYKKEHFILKAIILCTINVNPTCLALTRQIKGKTGCVVCVDHMESIYLPSSSKLVYMQHHRFLPPKHMHLLALIKHQFHAPTCRVNVRNNHVFPLSINIFPRFLCLSDFRNLGTKLEYFKG
jgi:hypothetical protein